MIRGLFVWLSASTWYSVLCIVGDQKNTWLNKRMNKLINEEQISRVWIGYDRVNKEEVAIFTRGQGTL